MCKGNYSTIMTLGSMQKIEALNYIWSTIQLKDALGIAPLTVDIFFSWINGNQASKKKNGESFCLLQSSILEKGFLETLHKTQHSQSNPLFSLCQCLSTQTYSHHKTRISSPNMSFSTPTLSPTQDLTPSTRSSTALVSYPLLPYLSYSLDEIYRSYNQT